MNLHYLRLTTLVVSVSFNDTRTEILWLFVSVVFVFCFFLPPFAILWKHQPISTNSTRTVHHQGTDCWVTWRLFIASTNYLRHCARLYMLSRKLCVINFKCGTVCNTKTLLLRLTEKSLGGFIFWAFERLITIYQVSCGLMENIGTTILTKFIL